MKEFKDYHFRKVLELLILLFLSILAVKCEELLAPPNGGFLAACDVVYNSVCEFQCDSGYNLVGSSLRRCQSNKEWSGTAVQCEGQWTLDSYKLT